MRTGGSARREHAGFLLLLAAFVGWYLWDATAAAFTTDNLLLVGPVGALAGVLLLLIAAGEVRAAARGRPDASAPAAPTVATLGLIAGFVLYVVALPWLGFDAATALFVAGVMLLLGERRVPVLLGLAVAIAALVSFGALALLTYPVPTALAGSLWNAL